MSTTFTWTMAPLLWATLAITPPTLPWTTFSGMLPDAGETAVSQCPQGVVGIVFFKERHYVLVQPFEGLESGSRFLLMYDPEPTSPNPPTHYARGTAVGDTIPTLVWSGLARDADVCGLLYGETV